MLIISFLCESFAIRIAFLFESYSLLYERYINTRRFSIHLILVTKKLQEHFFLLCNTISEERVQDIDIQEPTDRVS
jgi:hypothetical protein